MSAESPLKHPATTSSFGSLVADVIWGKGGSRQRILLMSRPFDLETHLLLQRPQIRSVQLVRVVDHVAGVNLRQDPQQLIDFTQNC